MDLARLYFDWAYHKCDELECPTLKEAADSFIESHTIEELSKVLGVELDEDSVAKLRESLKPLSDRLMVYCCGDPIINAYDSDVKTKYEKAVGEFLYPLVEEGNSV